MSDPTLLQVEGLRLDTPAGRPLLRELCLRLDRDDRVAIVGRNGGGKSTLLEVLADERPAERGRVVCRGDVLRVPQQLPRSPDEVRAGLSAGELRMRRLRAARDAHPDLLLLDEPTQDLDADGMTWLVDWLARFEGALIVVSHDASLLRGFSDFFVVAESGCRHVSGGFDALVSDLERESERQERRYLRTLQQLLERERRHDTIRRRRQRKKNLGHIHETRRCPSRMKLNENRSYAQASQGRRGRLQRERLDAARVFAQAARRALLVDLPLETEIPKLPTEPGPPIVILEHVSAHAGPRALFEDVSLELTRERLAITGPNGSGKSTLVELLVGARMPATGSARRDAARIGYVAQDASNWRSEDSLLDRLHVLGQTPDAAARTLRAHRFPFALAARPLASLSPGERLRAALVCLLQRQPAPELLVLDEPTHQLDFVGRAALDALLRTWPGGLVVVSHDPSFLEAVRIERELRLAATPALSASQLDHGATAVH